MDSRPNSVSPLPEMAPIAEFDKSPEETTTLEDLPPPPPTAVSIPLSEPPPLPETPKNEKHGNVPLSCQNYRLYKNGICVCEDFTAIAINYRRNLTINIKVSNASSEGYQFYSLVHSSRMLMSMPGKISLSK
ncbi:hypothetical protein J6590_045154 [Homalodisca vitripennis]|nr:hypothetical protein J6590_045154 [Homalodisca vitripennis]